jgi:hypothetical protein
MKAGKATAKPAWRNDPRRWYKQRYIHQLEAAMVEYLAGLAQRVQAAVKDGKQAAVLTPPPASRLMPDLSGKR